MEILKKIRNKIGVLPVLPVLLCLLVSFSVRNEQQPAAKIKAVFLYNFSHFAIWPEKAFSSPDEPFIIGVMGPNPLQGHLLKAVEGEKIQKRSYLVKEYSEVEEIDNCHILFITEHNNTKLAEILNAMKGKTTLTVGDAKDFAELGGMVQFVRKDNRIKLRINVQAAQQAQIQISSKLLMLAEIVSTKSLDEL